MTVENRQAFQRLLIQLRDLYAQLLCLENKKTELLAKGQVEMLSMLMNDEQAILMRCRSAEKARIELCSSENGIRICDLVSREDGPEELLSPIFSELCKIIKDLKKVNDRNIKLADTRLSTVRMLLKEIGIEGRKNEAGDTLRIKA
ncbi:MAG: flagellar protein FlgN [Clostridiaceae bacterium]|nr:flagellar protein FlgN [Clostridiaceae bacterium]